jgi:hypothetical protein
LVKLDLDLINELRHGRPVPVERELHLIKYFVGQRIKEVKINPELPTVERWDHSNVFMHPERILIKMTGNLIKMQSKNAEGNKSMRNDLF